MPRMLYRIVEGDPPGTNDFLSYAALGKRPIRLRPETLRLMTGLSMCGSLDAARAKGAGRPWQGTGFIVAIAFPNDGPAVIEQTSADAAHYTVWCDEHLIRSWIVDIVPILESTGDV